LQLEASGPGQLNARGVKRPKIHAKKRERAVTFIVQECIERVKAEITRTNSFPDSSGKRQRLAELEAMLAEYEREDTENEA
jgi:hypothetical protein